MRWRKSLVSLYEILRLTTGQLGIPWSISVAAFCKARAHFSPGGFVLVIWRAGLAVAKNLPGTQSLERLTPAGRRQNHPRLARIPFAYVFNISCWHINYNSRLAFNLPLIKIKCLNYRKKRRGKIEKDNFVKFDDFGTRLHDDTS